MKRKFTILLSLIMMGAAVLATPTITGKASEASVSPSVLNDANPTVTDVADLQKKINEGTETDIVLQKGQTYQLTEILFLRDNLTIDLNGGTIQKDSGTILMTQGPAPAGKYDGYKNITIKNGTIKRSGSAKDGLVIIGHATNVTFEKVTFSDANDAHMLEIGACKDVKVTGCTFKDGHYSSNEDKGEYEAFSMDISNSANFPVGPSDNYACENVTVTDCIFSNVRRAFGGHRVVSGHLFDNIIVKNCQFNNISGTALEAVGFKNSVIEGNKFNQVGFGIDCKPSSSKIISDPGTYNTNNFFNDNQIALTKSSSKVTCGVRISGNGSTKLSGFKVTKTTVTGPHAYAVYAGDVTDSLIDEVTSSGATSNGIRVENCSGVKVSNSNISKTKSHGICLINSTNDTVSGNTITDAKKHGIALEGATNETIVGNTITKPKKSGINLWKKSTCTLVAENKITKPKTCGINCQDKKSKVFATCANVVKKAGVRPYGGDGVFFAATNSVVTLKKGKGAKIDAYGKKGATKYSTEDKSVATVDSKGNIKAKGSGTTTVTAKRGKFKAQVKVTVK
ncbi:right-handed parallel beta-helix repeat-containing protein [Butyrivibrio sp. WCD2001]|uniref:right-handed parallel beta-helix repeat-containing protein n=1 Tax=Butyrivibrio sp. WCD2001 TaxID=1280681 RepID=UPI0003F59761|nr:right-handed parallel beta-helix repeat-containing protein [Butyrivibrio sp. WCD2001]